MEKYFVNAKPGYHFVMTESGKKRTVLKGTEQAKKERKVGMPIKGFEEKVPCRWLTEGYVEEVVKRG